MTEVHIAKQLLDATVEASLPSNVCSANSVMVLRPSLFHHFKPLHALAVALNGLEKHLCRAYPQTMFAIERAVHDHLLQCFGVLGEPFKAIAVSLEMPKLAADKILVVFCHVILLIGDLYLVG